MTLAGKPVWNTRLPELLVLLLAACVIGYRLDSMPMYLWDESRQANNALEMAKSGNFLFPTFQGKPDFWNTKPHLLIVLQALSFKLLGPGMLALRMPSALAGVATVWLWFRFMYRRGWKIAAWIFVLILLGCGGFNVYHIARTGDYDALLVLGFSLALQQLYLYIFESGGNKALLQFYSCIAISILIKSVAVLLWAPVFLLLLFAFRNQNQSKPKQWFHGLWIPVVVAFAYYGMHELLTPGYLKAVLDNEITGRYLAPNEGHQSEWYYYFETAFSSYFRWFWILLVPALIWLLKSKSNVSKPACFFLIAALGFIVTISTSKTRIHWYMAPAIPALAAFLAIAMQSVTDWIHRFNAFKWVAVLLSGMLLWAATDNWKKYWKENLEWEGIQPQVVFRDAETKGRFKINGTWLLGSYNPFEEFYGHIFRQKNIPFHTTFQYQFHKGDTVCLYRWDQLDSMGKYYHNQQIQAPDKQTPVWILVVDSVFQKP